MRNWWVGMVVACVVACGDNVGPTPDDGGLGAAMDSGATQGCEPGRSVGCVCTNGASGSQTCASDGQHYSGCVCAELDAGPHDTGPGLCSLSNPGGQCPGGQSCMGGLCVSPCSPSAPSGFCTGGQQCIAGACCAAPCGTACCTGSTFCVGSGGASACVAHCQTSATCSPSTSYCAALGDGAGGWVPDDGFCVPPGAPFGGPRRCNIDSDCTGGQACTPTLGSDGIPRRPFVCTDPACTPYHQCRGVLGSCPNGYCNLCGASGRCYCAQVCTSDAMCGTSAACIVFGTSHGSCPANQTACAPR